MKLKKELKHYLKDLSRSFVLYNFLIFIRAIIIVPSRELGEQVLDVSKSLSHVVKLRARFFSGGKLIGQKLLKQLSNESIDIVIGTPGRIKEFYFGKKYSIN